jgi:hypothetical protein
MFLTALSARGFADLPHYESHGLGRVVELRGPDPSCTALGDAVELGFAALSAKSLSLLLNRWGLLAPGEVPEISGEPFPDQATWTDQHAARALLPLGPERHLQVELEIEPDPVLYGELRAESAREPRLVLGLSDGGRITLGVGALFAYSFDAVAISLQRFEIGGQSFALHSSDRPPWINRFLRHLVERFYRHDSHHCVAAQALEAATCRKHFRDYQSWQGCLGDEKRLRSARGPGDRPIILCEELPLSRWGRKLEAQAWLGASIHLCKADVLWAETDEDIVRAAVEGDGSPLEQVFLVHPKGSTEVECIAEPDPPPIGVTTGPRG